MRKIALALAAAASLAVAKDQYCQAGYPAAVEVPSGYKLEALVSTSRHGARAPLTVVPGETNDKNVTWTCAVKHVEDLDGNGGVELAFTVPEFAPASYKKNTLNGNCYTGQLTLLGQQQTLALGEAVREVYVDKFGFLPDIFDPEETVFVSTDVPRTRESLVSFLQGLYPADKRANQTISAKVAISTSNPFTPQSDKCPRLGQLTEKVWETEGWIAARAKCDEALKKVNKIAGTTGQSTWDHPSTHGQWMDVLRARHCHDIPMPCDDEECLSEEDFFKIADMGDYQASHDYTLEDAPKLAIGVFMSHVAHILAEKLTSGSGPKYTHFSAHDSTIIPILTALGQEFVFPAFASSFLWEGWKDANGSAYVRCIYNGMPVVIPACGTEMCPLETYMKFIESNLRFTDFDTECAKV